MNRREPEQMQQTVIAATVMMFTICFEFSFSREVAAQNSAQPLASSLGADCDYRVSRFPITIDNDYS
jgi:hypothetical protein